jgi:peroxiredoxin
VHSGRAVLVPQPIHIPLQEFNMSVQVGAAAPDFTLDAHTGSKVTLSSFKGRKTVVAFMPFAFTGG